MGELSVGELSVGESSGHDSCKVLEGLLLACGVICGEAAERDLESERALV